MPEIGAASRWSRHLVHRTEHTRTTWKLRLGVLALLVVVPWLTSSCWTAAIGRSLVCEASLIPSDAILVENFDPGYLLFERARQLRQAGLAPRVLVPVPADPATRQPQPVALAMAQLMANLSRTGDVEIVPVREVEPITLNAARDVQSYLEREHLRSVIVVSPLFRSRRSALVNAATLERAGIVAHCEPVRNPQTGNDWTASWHGIQNVVEQWIKLQYYRLYVLPFRT